MKNKFKLILSCSFICVTLASLVIASFAWFKQTTHVTAATTGITASSGINVNLKAYKLNADNKSYLYNYAERSSEKADAKYENFTETSQLIVDDMVPNAMYTFAVEVTNAKLTGVNISVGSFSFQNSSAITVKDAEGNDIENFNAGFAYDIYISVIPGVVGDAGFDEADLDRNIDAFITGENTDYFTNDYFNSFDTLTSEEGGKSKMTQSSTRDLNSSPFTVSSKGSATVLMSVLFSNDNSTFFSKTDDGYVQDENGNSNIYKNMKFIFNEFFIS